MFLDLSGDWPMGIVIALGSALLFKALLLRNSRLLTFDLMNSFLNLAPSVSWFLLLLEFTRSVEPWLLNRYIVWLVRLEDAGPLPWMVVCFPELFLCVLEPAMY